MDLLFADLKVIDAASYLAGPGAATVMADYGADVIKVEPLSGDGYRTLAGNSRTDSNWQLTSRHKRSIALDLLQKDGRGVLQRLLEDADVLIVNFFDDQLVRFGIDYASVKRLNPRLIYARMSGYGTKGDEARTRGFDSTAWWARTGLMDLVRDQGQPPVMGSPGFGDHSSAMSLFGAIMLGLYRREKSGTGCCVETSLLANGVWANGMQVQGAIAGFDLGERRQAKGWLNPFASAYGTADNRFVLFAIMNVVREWPRLCAALDHPEWLTDERFPDVRAMFKLRVELKAMIADAIRTQSLEDIRASLDANDITYAVVQNLTEVINDPQARSNGVVLETGSDDPDFQLTVGSPIQVAEEDKRPPGPAPAIGEHTMELLAELGISDAEVADLLKRRVVARDD